ncbi:hypothetical protein CU669_11150 [Paramagnetospirillum kuznetsovii]|uniref:Uncharacterized protein n=1 Tax=Paramagnetospirillum kuznetsovii TaxID=2053833 RepID=A0A364NY70_9PROT|nr:hypothetical protein CU669_11150 [Paramagnetospirillum kuznetsovii]
MPDNDLWRTINVHTQIIKRSDAAEGFEAFLGDWGVEWTLAPLARCVLAVKSQEVTRKMKDAIPSPDFPGICVR